MKKMFNLKIFPLVALVAGTMLLTSCGSDGSNNNGFPKISYASDSWTLKKGTPVNIETTNTGAAISNCHISPDSLPAGLKFSTSTCSITGTPTEAMHFTTYVVTAKSLTGGTSTANLTIGVGALYIGAPNINTVYKCNFDGTNCASLKTGVTSAATDQFGSALFITNNTLFIGADEAGPNGTLGAGSLYSCPLNGPGCELVTAADGFSPPHPFLEFGRSIGAANGSLYVGATVHDLQQGSVYKCDLKGAGCAPVQTGIPDRGFADGFGGSILAVDQILFIGSEGDINTPPIGLYQCHLDGTNCVAANTGGVVTQATSLAVINNSLFVGSAAANSLHKCTLTATNCTSSAPAGVSGGFGNALAVTEAGSLIVGSNASGMVYKCDAAGENCNKLDTGLTTPDSSFGYSLFAY